MNSLDKLKTVVRRAFGHATSPTPRRPEVPQMVRNSRPGLHEGPLPPAPLRDAVARESFRQRWEQERAKARPAPVRTPQRPRTVAQSLNAAARPPLSQGFSRAQARGRFR